MRRVGSDRDRLRVREFFELNLSDRTGFPITTRQQDRQLGIPSILRINEDTAGNIVAAVYASNNPEDVIRWRQSGGNETVAQVISVEMMMIHDLAVLPVTGDQVSVPHWSPRSSTTLLPAVRPSSPSRLTTPLQASRSSTNVSGS